MKGWATSAAGECAAGGQQPAVDRDRVAGLDAIRFVCALWVVFSHFGLVPVFGYLAEASVWAKLLRGLCGNLFCGVAAVIVFFVISGFCIHFPFRNARSIPVAAFLARRYLRIGIPCAVAILAVSCFQSAEILGFYNAILWSLVAELIYYTLYPAMFPFLQKYGWRLVAGAYAIAFVVICLRPHAMNYHDFGPLLTWAVGLPCWLLGCMLARSFSSPAPMPDHRVLWLWRALIWFLASLSSILRFHGSIGYPLTLSVFAVACFCWLRLELRWFQAHPPCRSLERAGAWSYSLYLCHVPVLLIVGTKLTAKWTHGPYHMIEWPLQIAAGVLMSYIFFLAVERPTHRLARHVGRALRPGRLPSGGSSR